MTDVEKLALVKADLELLATGKDGYLLFLLQSAACLMEREGIHLADCVEDTLLQTRYAAYLYRRRAKDDATMPRDLRYALNNRLIHEKAGGLDAPG